MAKTIYYILFSFVMLNLIGLSGCTSEERQPELQTSQNPPIPVSNSPKPELENKPFTLHINRASKQMTIIDKNGAEVMKVPIGIGRGGLKPKRDMMDLVTPTGELVVDLILYQQETFNQVNPKLQEKYLQSEFREFFGDKQGLKTYLIR